MEPFDLNNIDINDSQLVDKFNKRDLSALEAVYDLFYSDLHHYAKMLHRETNVEACDVVHDAFIDLWNTKQQFQALINIKAFVLVIIKNSFKNYVSRQKYREKQLKGYLDDDYFVVQVAETEIYSVINKAIDLLPEECVKVIKLTLEGWDVKEISTKLEKKESTIYNQRREAMRILKEKLPKDQLLLFLMMIN